MTLVVVPDDAFGNEFVATRGFGGPGISKIGAGIQAGRLGYRLANKAYQKYFRFATKNKNRQAGTGTGAGIGIGAGIVGIFTSGPSIKTYQDRQTRDYMVKPGARRFQSRCYPTRIRRKRRR